MKAYFMVSLLLVSVSCRHSNREEAIDFLDKLQGGQNMYRFTTDVHIKGTSDKHSKKMISRAQSKIEDPEDD